MKTILKFTNPAFALVVLACFGLSPVLQATDLGSVVGPVLNANTGDGAGVLTNLTTGVNNSGFGYFALDSDTSGSSNTAVGRTALFANTLGLDNTAIGRDALRFNNSSFNTAVGLNALFGVNGNSNVGIGVFAGSSLTTGVGNVCIGVNVFGVAGESNTTRIRNIFPSLASGRAVYVNSDHKLGTLASSRRFKEEIKPMEKASETLFALKPVTFRYKKEVDSAQALSFGLIAEEVAKVDSDLITRDEEGKPETVRYEAVNAMLLNEFLKEHRKVDEQEKTIAELKSGMNSLAATVKEQASQIQKVSAQLEASKPASQVVLNNQ
jgi:endosialidase-like protein